MANDTDHHDQDVLPAFSHPILFRGGYTDGIGDHDAEEEYDSPVTRCKYNILYQLLLLVVEISFNDTPF